MPFGLSDKTYRKICDVLASFPKIEEVMIYGSRAKGTEREGSDIDLAIKGENITYDDIIKIHVKLDSLEMLYQYDVLNYTGKLDEGMRRSIDKYGVVFYKKEEKETNWQSYKLIEVADIIGGGTPSTNKDMYFGGNIAWLTPKDLTNWSDKYIERGERNITDEGLKNSSARLMPAGTVLMTSRAPIGYLAIAKNKIATNQGFKSFIVNDTKVNNEFLYYLLKANIELIKSKGTGSTFPEVSASILKDIEFKFPSIRIQKEIVSILSSIDDKIELNRQMNQTLEDTARAIFKEWFVDFNFPGFDGKLVNGLPKGWKMGKLGEDFNLIMGQSPPGESYNETGKGKIFFQGRTDFGFRYPTIRIFTTEPTRAANKFDTLVSVRAPVGDINMALNDCCIGRGLSAIRHKTGSYSYTYYMMKSLTNVFKGFEGDGTVFGSINRLNFENIEITIPPEAIVNQFEKTVNDIDEKIFNNSMEITSLISLRDRLLPNLVTGKKVVLK
jgi:type I restriction enzyme S subunit